MSFLKTVWNFSSENGIICVDFPFPCFSAGDSSGNHTPDFAGGSYDFSADQVSSVTSATQWQGRVTRFHIGGPHCFQNRLISSTEDFNPSYITLLDVKLIKLNPPPWTGLSWFFYLSWLIILLCTEDIHTNSQMFAPGRAVCECRALTLCSAPFITCTIKSMTPTLFVN